MKVKNRKNKGKSPYRDRIMKKAELKNIAACGEDSCLQFKQDICNVDALTAEMVAFSNSDGGRILIGVTDSGELDGVYSLDVNRINQLISNAASKHVRSPISPITENIIVGKDRIVIVVNITKGIDKPYFDRRPHMDMNNVSLVQSESKIA